jgi:hypothetical protein
MKTAMQLLFEEFESLSKASRNAGDIETAGLIDFLCERKAVALEKEKEQIMNAYCDGAKGGANGTKGQHEFGWVSRHTRKKYYNQTYNQNK